MSDIADDVPTAVLDWGRRPPDLALLSSLLEAMPVHAFLCDREARVTTLSPPAQALARDGRHLKMRGGRLQAARGGDTIGLQAAIAATARAAPGERPGVRPVVVRDVHGGAPLLLELSRVPGDHARRLGAAVLVLARTPPRDASVVGERAKALLGLTNAEAVVAGQLSAGAAPAAIAEHAGVSIGTVRTHIRGIFAKAGVRSVVELVAILADLR